MESVSMPLLANYAYSGMDLKKGSWLVINDDMGHDAVSFFSEEFTGLGGEMTEGAVFEATEMDLRNKISKVMENDPEFIIVLGRGAAMINACRQIRERDADIPIFGNTTMENDIIWEALGTLGDNIWYPKPYVDYESERYIRINGKFLESFGHEMNWLSVYGFSIANYLARGLKESKGDKYAMKEYLQNLNYPSIRGLLTMNEDSDVNVVNVICQRKNGKSIIVDINE
jgi:ABC-type branched-subunit amino acid transport system substrate-binding protein